jgi:hypothetical protein
MNEQNSNQQSNHIPDFSSIEEEAAFWDTHDTTDFEEEFHPVAVHFDKHLSEYHLSKKLEVRFDTETDDKLTAIAHEQGMKKSAFVRWVVKNYLRDRDRNAS